MRIKADVYCEQCGHKMEEKDGYGYSSITGERNKNMECVNDECYEQAVAYFRRLISP